MKSSTLMAIILVVQAVLIVGVSAAVSIENSAAPAVGEEDSMGPFNPVELIKCCKKCTATNNSGEFKCDDVFKTAFDCYSANCTICSQYRSAFKCNDAISGECGPKECKKN